MVPGLIFLITLIVGSTFDIQQWLAQQRFEHDTQYQFLLLDSQGSQFCPKKAKIILQTISQAYSNRSDIKYHYFKEYKVAGVFELDISDLPAFRVFYNHTLYALKELDPKKVSIFDSQNLIEKKPLQLPLTSLQISLTKLSYSYYMQFVRDLTGDTPGYNPTLVIKTIAIFFTLFALVCSFIYSYFKKHGSQELKMKHIIICLALWIGVKILLIPSYSFDILYHYFWKKQAISNSVDQLYLTQYFTLDYPPFFIYFEKFWGYVLYFLVPQEFAQPDTRFKSFYFFVLMRFTVILTDLIYFYTLIKLFRFAQNYNSRQKSVKTDYNVNLFGLLLFDGALLAVDNINFQYNSLIFSLLIWSVMLIIQKRLILSALLYCIAVLTKQIAIYYSVAYVGYILFHYILFIRKSRIYKIQWKRFIMLSFIISGTILFAFYPLRNNIKEAIYQIGGGQNSPVSYSMIPTLQYLYAFLLGGITKNLVNIPQQIAISLIVICSIALMIMIYRE